MNIQTKARYAMQHVAYIAQGGGEREEKIEALLAIAAAARLFVEGLRKECEQEEE